ncbi:hypothetical protein [Salicibibacter cibi]|uniref:hypothetical protein n=1 Tax=Salicibibacter cibi TaxID=2743001 RepID=UPI001B7D86AD|nr:hypothetical protein [Salicibibacter cibi]
MYRKHSVGMAASWRPNEHLAFVFGHHEPFHGGRGGTASQKDIWSLTIAFDTLTRAVAV